MAAATDRPQSVGLYAQLARLTPSPFVELNRVVAVAVAIADGPGAGLPLVDRPAATGEFNNYYLLPATWAEHGRLAGYVDSSSGIVSTYAASSTEPSGRASE